MSTATDGPAWGIGVLAGVIGAIVSGLFIWFGVNDAIIAVHIPGALGTSGSGVGWVIFLVIGAIIGLIYAALSGIEQIGGYATSARTGGLTGLVYGILWWIIAIVAVPLLLRDGLGGIGTYAVTLNGVLGWALLGVVIGIIYQLAPLYLPER